jgi:signal transduction histidine kinase
LLQEQMRRNATTLITDIAPDAQYVQVVPEHLRQIVLNLVLNAVDAMPDGGDARLLAVRAGDNVRITVRDNGAGVQVHEDENVFDPLMTTKSNGSGLGLYVCKQLVAYNGGTIGYTNRSEGADFFFELPAPSA